MEDLDSWSFSYQIILNNYDLYLRIISQNILKLK